MEARVLFYVIVGLWGVATVANLIAAARICHAIEARSGKPMLKGALPGFANIIPIALNRGVAQDDETQALRWEMNKRLLIILAGIVFFVVYLRLTGQAG
jgi:hypothetical protein